MNIPVEDSFGDVSAAHAGNPIPWQEEQGLVRHTSDKESGWCSEALLTNDNMMRFDDSGSGDVCAAHVDTSVL